MKTQYLERAQGRLAFDDRGTGQLVICVPSMGDVRQEYRFLAPMLVEAGSLARVFPNKGAAALDAVLWSFNNIGIVFIAVFAFPLLRKLDEALAVGYLASRIIEGTTMMVGIIATLLHLPHNHGSGPAVKGAGCSHTLYSCS